MKKTALTALTAACLLNLTGCMTDNNTTENITEEAAKVSEYVQMTDEELLADRGGERPPEGYNTLQDVSLINEKLSDGSFGFGQPDKEQACFELPSVGVPAGEGTVVIRNWNTTDLSAYIPSGRITFYAKSEAAGGSFDVAVQDCDRDRKGSDDSVTIYKNTADYGRITNDWTLIEIPFKDYFEEGNGLDPTCVWTLRIGNAEGNIRMADLRITSPDKELCGDTIKVNQLGYNTDSPKYALVSGFYEELDCNSKTSFSLVNAENNEEVFSGMLTLADGYDEAYSGETVYKADFSDYKENGRYFLTVNTPEKESSAVFTIGSSVYSKKIGTLCKYYYFQRANVELTEEYSGQFAREALYTDDFNMVYLSDKSRTRDVSGGWFDAGDFGKYVDPGSVAVVDLLWAYKLFPEAFTDGASNIPESGNNIPDILDEVKIELDFILKMQDEDGGFYHRVNPDDGSRAIVDTFANGDGGNIKAAGTTANAAAALALAHTAYKDVDPEYADKLLSAAVKGWDYAIKNPDITSSGTYGSDKTDHQIFFAACTLFYATGEEEYHDHIRENYKNFSNAYDMSTFGHSSDNMKKLAFAEYLACENKDAEITEWISKKFSTWKKNILSNAAANPWGTPLPDWALWWGSNSNALNTAMEMYITEYYLDGNTADSEKLASETINFIFGINPTGRSFVTGIGENSIKRTYSGIFGEDGIEEFPEGYTPGGINMYDGSIISRFPGKCHSDTALDWVTDENSIYYQSSLIFAAAMQTAKE